MDYFEGIVATLLEAESFWVRRSFKVNLSKEDKRAIKKPSIPRPEIDLLALDFKKNEVILFEAKSYLDSRGVSLAELQENNETPEGRYKLFTCETYKLIVFKKLKEQLILHGMANENTKLTLGLAAGKIFKKQSNLLRRYFDEKEWVLWSPEDIKQKVELLASRSYENDPAIITAKILMRNPFSDFRASK